MSFTQWRNADGCGSGAPDTHVDVGTSSFCDTHEHCNAAVQVELCSVDASQASTGGGHILYLNPDINIAQTAWDFLSQFTLPAE